MSTYNGNHVTIDYGGLELTEELQEALQSLDHSCQHGCGGTWEIYEENPDFGFPYRAIFLDMSTDELVWDSEDGTWTDGNEFDDGDDEEEEDEEDESNEQ